MKDALPFSEACERNKAPILEVLREALPPAGDVLEVGSGTGQHAVWFARHLPQVRWQPTELADQLPALRARLRQEAPGNVREPVALDVMTDPWLWTGVAAVFSANTLHIMSWPHVEAFLRGVGRVLADDGVLCVYGPFRYGSAFTTPSNEQFDRWLKARDALSGVRDFEAVDELARTQGLQLVADHALPANNQALVWRRVAGA